MLIVLDAFTTNSPGVIYLIHFTLELREFCNFIDDEIDTSLLIIAVIQIFRCDATGFAKEKLACELLAATAASKILANAFSASSLLLNVAFGTFTLPGV